MKLKYEIQRLGHVADFEFVSRLAVQAFTEGEQPETASALQRSLDLTKVKASYKTR